MAYLILTGQAPATQRSALIDRVTADGGLRAHAVVDGLTDALDELIFQATRSGIADRLDSAERFLDREFLAEFRALAAERGQDWGRVLTIDARFAETGRISPGLGSYLRAVWARVEQRLQRLASEERVVLFVHGAGLLARYYDEGGHDVLIRLQNAARRPADVPHGLWLLCPAESASDTPTLDGRTVEVHGDAERVVLDGQFLDGLRRESGTAA